MIQQSFIKNEENDQAYKFYSQNQSSPKLDGDSEKTNKKQLLIEDQDEEDEFEVVELKDLSPEAVEEVAKEIINGLLKKYFIQVSQQEKDSIRSCIMNTKIRGVYLRNLREKIAAIILIQYNEILKMSSNKRFCRLNDLALRPFNKAYRAYLKIYRQKKIEKDKEQQQSDQKLKLQEKEDTTQKRLLENSWVNKTTGQVQKIRVTPIQALQFIFDSLFQTRFLQDKRHQIIETLVSKYQKTSPHILDAMNWTKKSLAKFYYLIFYYIKTCGNSASFNMIKTAVEEKTNIVLSKIYYEQTKKLFKVKGQSLNQAPKQQQSNNWIIEQTPCTIKHFQDGQA